MTVTVHEAGAASATSAAAVLTSRPEKRVTDARGRSILLRKPTLLQNFRFVAAMGQDAQNDAFMRMAAPLLWVAEIDGDQVPAPSTRLQFDGLVQRVEEEGMEAVLEGLTELMRDTAGTEDPVATVKP